MPLSAGARLGPYEVLTSIGAGGMGEVYKARDTRLDRTVAIKVLPDIVAGDPEARARFEREARSISQLSHPHICALHDVGREGDVEYLVLEYLEGETLARRIESGPLPLEKALTVATQIADALDKAHRQGIVHRDLKPGNVMLTRAGAKLLDFGLAKATGLVGASSPSTTLTAAPTRTTPLEGVAGGPLTAQGTILGTFQYMSPEQIEGIEADARSDIWAFGCVLSEMLTGRRAFSGRTHASLIGAILKDDAPSVAAAQPLAPPALDRVIRTCLAKDPDDRFQTAHDLLLQLKWLAEGGAGPAASAPESSGPGLRGWIAWAVAGLAVLVALGVAAAGFIREEPAGRVVSLALPPPGGSFGSGAPAVSPDGGKIVFSVRDAGRRTSLWVRSLDRVEPQAIPGTEDGVHPFWSPDGAAVGFFADGKLKTIDVTGGPARTLAEVSGRGGTWNEQGDILVGQQSGGLVRVSAAGGAAATVTSPAPGHRSHRWPQFLPNGRDFLVFVIGGAETGTYRGSLGTSELVLVYPGEVPARFVEPGYLVFVRESALLAQPFDPASGLSGEPVVLGDSVAVDGQVVRAMADVSPQVLVYQGGGSRDPVRVEWVDRTGVRRATTLPPGEYMAPALSRDGRFLAAHRNDEATDTSDVWTFDLERAVSTRLTRHSGSDAAAIWSPEGTRIVFGSERDAKERDLWMASASQPGSDELLLADEHYKTPTDWSRDGRYLLFSRRRLLGPSQEDVMALPIDGDRSPLVVAASEFSERDGHVSPDGHWVAYASNETGRWEIYVQSFPAPGTRVTVSTGGGQWPTWRDDGRELYFLDPTDRLMAVPVTVGGSTLALGVPAPLFEAVIGGTRIIRNLYEAGADGQRFLVVAPGDDEARERPLTVIVNWRERIRK